MENKEPEAFTVIIVGGGFTGLSLAHSLSLVNINYTLLEAHSTFTPEIGASVGFWPHGMRLLSQLGCADEIRKVSKEMNLHYVRGLDGNAIMEIPLFEQIRERHGFEFRNLARSKALEILYNKLWDKSRILNNRRVNNIEDMDKYVTVTTTEGETFYGHLVVGCDGTHSTVRDLMWKNAEERHGIKIAQREKEAFRSEYRCMVGMASGIPELETTADMHITTLGVGKVLQLVTQPNSTFWILYEKLNSPVTGCHRIKYRQEEVDAAAARVAGKQATATITFGDIYKRRKYSCFVQMEEGMFKRWHSGRIAIAGDASHKVAPNLAFGANSCLEAAAVLANELRLIAGSQETIPSSKELTKALIRYQATHQKRMIWISQLSYHVPRVQAWDGFTKRFLAKLLPYLPLTTLANACAKVVKGATKLELVNLKEEDKQLEEAATSPWN